MNDPEIRVLLYPLLQGGLYVDELPTGTTRADVVHITEHFMHGYELKGDADTLQRVAKQLPCYAKAYDFVTFVVTEKHVPKLRPLLPEWVGIQVATADGLRTERPALYNATVERPAVAALLRHSEVQQYLLARGLPGVSTLRRREVLSFLRTTRLVSLADLARHVRERLMGRMDERLAVRAERKAERERVASRRRRKPRK
ncbi:sce7726 family protein [Hymenobacter sp. J193]|uniref:sce7726 family protein n=1 Tax=Hymenobacter sp. J193 TaxID=2898429 RepID=UPI002151BABB|nr:sce7726 family protein [Hymenobacter sp. J193]MCR5889305.1 sce7726 family protein [Hymenobacter sp. J193]